MPLISLSPGAWIDHDVAFVAAADADRLIADLRAELAWEQREIVLFGRRVLQPRLIAWAGELGYRYSGQTLEPRAWTPALARLHADVVSRTAVAFNHALVNRYRDGRDSMGMHADAEPELGSDPVVATMSLGATRRFVIESRRGGERQTIELGHGSLLVMGGSCQREYRHGIPRAPHVSGERISVTFRRLERAPGR